MLKSLYVKDFAIISELTVEFNSGFNVFTGETGAGKSIIVGALSYLMKGKADPSVIRRDAQKAIVEGVFSIDEYMRPILDEASIEYDEELIIRRIISRDNRNSIRINQCSVTLNFLNELFSEHIDIHSQKDSQYLLNRNNHLTLLDRFADDGEILNKYSEHYSEYRKKRKEYDSLLNETYNESELEYVRFDLDELVKANLDPEEEKELEQKEKRYKSAEKYLSSLNSVMDLYDGEGGISERLSILIRELNLDDKTLTEIRDSIERINYDLSDQIDLIRRILDGYNDEDLDIERIEERLYSYSRLKRKYGLDTEGLIRKKSELEEHIRFFEDRDYVLSEKKKELDASYQIALDSAGKLHQVRIESARKLEERIGRECKDLMLENADFKVEIKETEIGNKGMDDIEFFVSMNKGEDLKPLRQVASGGEISRLMLALKSVLTSLSETSLVIFDEIDTGISGRTALAIGQKMARIAVNTQVLAITHLAAVAACAGTHFYIYKNEENDTTTTFIRQLNRGEIINELAFISNADNSEASKRAAEELYHTAQESIN